MGHLYSVPVGCYNNRMSRTRPVRGVKHLPFFEVLASAPPASRRARRAKAGLLVLRLVEHSVLVGPAVAEPDSRRIISVRAALQELGGADPIRHILIGIVNALQASRNVDIAPILPRLAAYGMLLRLRSESSPLADDVDTVVARLSGHVPQGNARPASGSALICIRSLPLR